MDNKEQIEVAKSALADMWLNADRIERILVKNRHVIEYAMDNGDCQVETCTAIGDLVDKLERVYVLAKAIGYGCRP